MSASANIVIGTETGLVLPNSAVKISNGQSYVDTFSPPLAGSTSNTGVPSATAPTPVGVTTGLSSDTNIIIRSGLSAGAQVVTKTIAGTAVTTASSAARSTSLFGGATGGTPGGGAVRALTR